MEGTFEDFEGALGYMAQTGKFKDYDDRQKVESIRTLRDKYLDKYKPSEEEARLIMNAAETQSKFFKDSRIRATSKDLQKAGIQPLDPVELGELDKDSALAKIEEFRESAEIKKEAFDPIYRDDFSFDIDREADELERRVRGRDTGAVADKGYRFSQGFISAGLRGIGQDEMAQDFETTWFPENPEYDDRFVSKLATAGGDMSATVFMVAGATVASGGNVAVGASVGLATNGVRKYQDNYNQVFAETGNKSAASDAGLAAIPSAVLETMGDTIVGAGLAGNLTKQFRKEFMSATSQKAKAEVTRKYLKDSSFRKRVMAEGLKGGTSEGVFESAGALTAGLGAKSITGDQQYVPTAKELAEEGIIAGIVGGTVSASGAAFNREELFLKRKDDVENIRTMLRDKDYEGVSNYVNEKFKPKQEQGKAEEASEEVADESGPDPYLAPKAKEKVADGEVVNEVESSDGDQTKLDTETARVHDQLRGRLFALEQLDEIESQPEGRKKGERNSPVANNERANLRESTSIIDDEINSVIPSRGNLFSGIDEAATKSGVRPQDIELFKRTIDAAALTAIQNGVSPESFYSGMQFRTDKDKIEATVDNTKSVEEVKAAAQGARPEAQPNIRLDERVKRNEEELAAVEKLNSASESLLEAEKGFADILSVEGEVGSKAKADALSRAKENLDTALTEFDSVKQEGELAAAVQSLKAATDKFNAAETAVKNNRNDETVVAYDEAVAEMDTAFETLKATKEKYGVLYQSQPNIESGQDQGITLDINRERVFALLGDRMYNSSIGSVMNKEISQNSFDAIKEAEEQGVIEKGEGFIGRMEYADEDANTTTVTYFDNGIGMTPEIIKSAFFTLGGTVKGNAKTSGGFGLAKMGIFMAANNIELKTTRDGVTSTVKVNSEELLGDTPFNIKTESTPNRKNGTILSINIDSEIEKEDGSIEKIYLPSLNLDEGSVMHDVKEINPTAYSSVVYDNRYRQIDEWYDGVGLEDYDIIEENLFNTPPSFETLQEEDGFQKKTVSYGSVTADVYYKEIPKEKGGTMPYSYYALKDNDPDHRRRVRMPIAEPQIYSNGMLQFREAAVVENPLELFSDKIPFVFLVDIDASSLDASERAYPFNNSREGFNRSGNEGIYNQIKKEVINPIREDYILSKINKEFTAIEGLGGKPAQRDQPVFYNNTTLELSESEKESLEKIAVDVYDLIDAIVEAGNQEGTLLFDTEGFNGAAYGADKSSFENYPEPVSKTEYNKAKADLEKGTITKEEFDDIDYAYNRQVRNYYYGVGISKGWGGVNNNLNDAILVNPLYFPERVYSNISAISSMLFHISMHEANHITHRNEGAGFTYGLAILDTALSENGIRDEFTGRLSTTLFQNDSQVLKDLRTARDKFQASEVLDEESELQTNKLNDGKEQNEDSPRRDGEQERGRSDSSVDNATGDFGFDGGPAIEGGEQTTDPDNQGQGQADATEAQGASFGDALLAVLNNNPEAAQALQPNIELSQSNRGKVNFVDAQGNKVDLDGSIETFNDNLKAVITIMTEGGDISTFFHESMHYFHKSGLINSILDPEQRTAFENAAGVTPDKDGNSTWTTDNYEAVARAYEAWLRNPMPRKGPNRQTISVFKPLEKAFRRISRLFTQLYGSLRNSNLPFEDVNGKALPGIDPAFRAAFEKLYSPRDVKLNQPNIKSEATPTTFDYRLDEFREDPDTGFLAHPDIDFLDPEAQNDLYADAEANGQNAVTTTVPAPPQSPSVNSQLSQSGREGGDTGTAPRSTESQPNDTADNTYNPEEEVDKANKLNIRLIRKLKTPTFKDRRAAELFASISELKKGLHADPDQSGLFYALADNFIRSRKIRRSKDDAQELRKSASMYTDNPDPDVKPVGDPAYTDSLIAKLQEIEYDAFSRWFEDVKERNPDILEDKDQADFENKSQVLAFMADIRSERAEKEGAESDLDQRRESINENVDLVQAELRNRKEDDLPYIPDGPLKDIALGYVEFLKSVDIRSEELSDKEAFDIQLALDSLINDNSFIGLDKFSRHSAKMFLGEYMSDQMKFRDPYSRFGLVGILKTLGLDISKNITSLRLRSINLESLALNSESKRFFENLIAEYDAALAEGQVLKDEKKQFLEKTRDKFFGKGDLEAHMNRAGIISKIIQAPSTAKAETRNEYIRNSIMEMRKSLQREIDKGGQLGYSGKLKMQWLDNFISIEESQSITHDQLLKKAEERFPQEFGYISEVNKWIRENITDDARFVSEGLYNNPFTMYDYYLPTMQVALDPESISQEFPDWGESWAESNYSDGVFIPKNKVKAKESSALMERSGYLKDRYAYATNLEAILNKSIDGTINDIYTGFQRKKLNYLLNAGPEGSLSHYISEALGSTERMEHLRKTIADSIATDLRQHRYVTPLEGAINRVRRNINPALLSSAHQFVTQPISGFAMHITRDRGIAKYYGGAIQLMHHAKSIEGDVNGYKALAKKTFVDRAPPQDELSAKNATVNRVSAFDKLDESIVELTGIEVSKIHEFKNRAKEIDHKIKDGLLAPLRVGDLMSTELMFAAELIRAGMETQGISDPLKIDYNAIPKERITRINNTIDEAVNASRNSRRGTYLANPSIMLNLLTIFAGHRISIASSVGLRIRNVFDLAFDRNTKDEMFADSFGYIAGSVTQSMAFTMLKFAIVSTIAKGIYQALTPEDEDEEGITKFLYGDLEEEQINEIKKLRDDTMEKSFSRDSLKNAVIRDIFGNTVLLGAFSGADNFFFSFIDSFSKDAFNRDKKESIQQLQKRLDLEFENLTQEQVDAINGQIDAIKETKYIPKAFQSFDKYDLGGAVGASIKPFADFIQSTPEAFSEIKDFDETEFILLLRGFGYGQPEITRALSFLERSKDKVKEKESEAKEEQLDFGF